MCDAFANSGVVFGSSVKVEIPELLRRAGVSLGPLIEHVEIVFGNNPHYVPFTPLLKPPIVVTDPASTSFLSYTGGYTLQHFQESLATGCSGAHVWVDLFSVDQFAWTFHRRQPLVMSLGQELCSSLESKIGKMKAVYVLLDRWDNLMDAVGQIWVLWEIYNATRTNRDIHLVHHVFEILRFSLASHRRRGARF